MTLEDIFTKDVKLGDDHATETAETASVANDIVIVILSDELNTALNSSQTQMAGMQVRIDQMNAALSNAQRFETVGRLTGDVAQDFAQMLQVVNGALDVMARTTESPESVRRLAEAALIAGRRGERLTRQLQAFQSEEF
jgi:signal transduction histidine kinase